jgi:hypothetical protein
MWRAFGEGTQSELRAPRDLSGDPKLLTYRFDPTVQRGIPLAACNVRFWSNSGHRADMQQCAFDPKRTFGGATVSQFIERPLQRDLSCIGDKVASVSLEKIREKNLRRRRRPECDTGC